MVVRAYTPLPISRPEALVPSSTVNPPEAETPRQPSPATVPNALRLYDGSKMVTVDRASLRTLPSANEDTGAERPGSLQFRRFDGLLADTLIERTPVLAALKGQPDVYVNPEGKVVVERDTDVYNSMLTTLRKLADVDTANRAANGNVGTAIKVGLAMGTGSALTGAGIVVAAGAATGPVGLGALAVTAGAVAATAIYLNAKDAVGHLATEQRVNNLVKYGKIDSAKDMGERIGHYFDNSCLRTVALCVTGSASDTAEAYEKIAVSKIVGEPIAPTTGRPSAL
jgi:hypothetical protein